MTEPTAVVDYAARRIAVALPDAYDEARVHHEQVVYEQVVADRGGDPPEVTAFSPG